jgi:uncharacterized protein (DUF2384 family)
MKPAPDVLEQLRELIPDADDWLNTPNRMFDDQPPRSLLGTEREHLLRELVERIAAGDFA